MGCSFEKSAPQHHDEFPVEGVEINRWRLESHMKLCDVMAGRLLDEDIVVTVLLEPCVEELLDKLETRRLVSYKEVRDDVVASR